LSPRHVHSHRLAPWRYDTTTPLAPERRDVAKPSPETLLWCAVIEEAWRILQRPRLSAREIIAAREAVDWFTSDDERPQSFRWVCALLGMDAGVLRAGIVEYERARRGKRRAA